jgi:hypothetical protein
MDGRRFGAYAEGTEPGLQAGSSAAKIVSTLMIVANVIDFVVA